jgi:beta-lactamase regulating signal transducer with metallopeptidase domain
MKNLLKISVISALTFWLAGCSQEEADNRSVAQKFIDVERSLNSDNSSAALQSATETQTLLIVLILVVAVGILVAIVLKNSKKAKPESSDS